MNVALINSCLLYPESLEIFSGKEITLPGTKYELTLKSNIRLLDCPEFKLLSDSEGLTILIISLFAFIILRGFFRAFKETDLFVQLSVAGLLAQFGLQAIINLASTVNLMPTKGMTLPFISYGGSSLFAVSIAMGMVLALTRERPSSKQGFRINWEGTNA